MIKGFKTYKNYIGYIISLVYVDGKESKSYFSTIEKAMKMKKFLTDKGYICLN